ncbi:hypothetical protein [Bosea vaviloviae]|uniref:Uncharacterized protein n=1 Tax=Bosea vaviloviae TaxID=1526658 RepID=A0A0N1F3W8_9HYPH|nr:hypothetical protein [Bosea vaviloviae]KPH80672.1 hypothetical protein AE618_13115 [Bosea vaviloviae]
MTIDVSHRDLFANATPASAGNLAAAKALAGNHADALIISLAVEYEHARAAREHSQKVLGAAEARYVQPQVPAALLPRRGDPLCFRPCRTHDGTWWYVNLIDTFRKGPITRPATTHDGEEIVVPYQQAQARADEIVAAYDRWTADCTRAKIECGLAAADDEDTRLYVRMWELHDQLIAMRPMTFAGIQAKARASQLRRELVERGEECDTDLQLLFSISDDLVRLGDDAA